MKKIVTSCLFLGGLLWFSCSNDFDLVADWKDIPVVYGTLNKQDSAHYIRVEKAFLDPNTSALEIAKIPDSLYYDENLLVQLERVSTEEKFTLTRVDGNLEGYPRDEGVFATSPNYLYKIDSSEILLQGGEQIRLLIDRGNDLPLVTAETRVLGDLDLRDPSPNSNISFVHGAKTRVRWGKPAEARIFDLRILIQYSEFEIANPILESKVLEWEINNRVLVDEFEDFGIVEILDGEEFYLFMKNSLEANPELARFLTGLRIQITGGGEELSQFIEISLVNTGITSAQEIPTFSNLSEGEGIYSSKTVLRTAPISLALSSRDSLRNGVHTKNLNFQ